MGYESKVYVVNVLEHKHPLVNRVTKQPCLDENGKQIMAEGYGQIAEAKRMGNKNPDDNFVIKRAKEHMESAQKRLAEVTEKSKQAELNNEKD